MRLTLRSHLLAVSVLAIMLAPARLAGASQDAPASTPPDGLQTPASAKPAGLTDHQMGDLYMARKMFREAIDMYRKAMTGTADWALWNKIGIAYHHMQDFKAAKKSYEKALKVNPQYAEARNNLGTVAHARKDYRGAIREYQRALKVDPYSATIYSNLGTAYFARKRYDDALKAYQQALKLDPEVFETHNAAGTILQERTVEERAKYHYYLAKTYAEAGMTDRAMSYVRKSLEEGFKDKKKYMEEPAFATMRDLPEFQQLMTAEFRAL